MAVVIDQPLRLPWRASGHVSSLRNVLTHRDGTVLLTLKCLFESPSHDLKDARRSTASRFVFWKHSDVDLLHSGLSSLTGGLCFTRKKKSLLCCAGFVSLSDIVYHPARLAILFRHWHHILTDCLPCCVFRQAEARDSGRVTTERRHSRSENIRINIRILVNWVTVV